MSAWRKITYAGNARLMAWIILLVLAAGIKTLSFFPAVVERGYATGIYPFIARGQRILFGWIPFSIGDILYLGLIIWLIVGLVRLIRRLVRRQVDGPWLLSRLRGIVFFCLLVYVLFNGCWGLNYDRRGIADQLQLDVRPYTTQELTTLVGLIVGRLNELDSLTSPVWRQRLTHSSELFKEAATAYADLAVSDPRFRYPTPSVKTSLFGYLGDYLGFGGYYNPFTGEAQVKTTGPVFIQPYTTCHEIGHQLGYAKENEANFAGYLSAKSSSDPAFHYSMYCDLYLYAARELYFRDSGLVKPFRERLRPAVRRDFRELQAFNRRWENPFEPVIRRWYGSYLKANRQPQGIRTYNEVIAWLIAYAKKNGWQAI